MKLSDLEIYRISEEISNKGWAIYNKFTWQEKRIIGEQFIRAIDSIGANIAEGFGRYHYLDKNRFNYNARGSLLESIHWLDLLYKRSIINNEEYETIYSELKKLHLKLNNYIKITKSQIT
jgi:four helix bundle protein